MIDRAKLVRDDISGFAAEPTGNAIGIRMPSSRQWHDNRCAKMMVKLIQRDDSYNDSSGRSGRELDEHEHTAVEVCHVRESRAAGRFERTHDGATAILRSPDW